MRIVIGSVVKGFALKSAVKQWLEKAGHTVRLGVFEFCPSWAPGEDGCQRSAPIILKVLGFERFDHSASWPAIVRNASRLGSL